MIDFAAGSHLFPSPAIAFAAGIRHPICYRLFSILIHATAPSHINIIRHYVFRLKLKHADGIVHRLMAVPGRKYHVSPVTGGVYSCHKSGCGTVHQHICCKCSIHLLHLGNTVRYEHRRLMHVVKIFSLSEIMCIHPVPEVFPGF